MSGKICAALGCANEFTPGEHVTYQKFCSSVCRWREHRVSNHAYREREKERHRKWWHNQSNEKWRAAVQQSRMNRLKQRIASQPDRQLQYEEDHAEVLAEYQDLIEEVLSNDEDTPGAVGHPTPPAQSPAGPIEEVLSGALPRQRRDRPTLERNPPSGNCPHRPRG